jgi:type I restriction enzyme S subunit
MDAFAGAIGVSDSAGRCSPVYDVYAPRGEASTRYYAYFLRHLAWSGLIQSLAKGIRERSTAFDATVARDLLLPVPPLGEQTRIADNLDAETARIDGILAASRRIELLMSERVWSRFCAMAAASGAPKVPLRRVLLSIVDGPFGSAFTSGDYTNDGAFVVRLGNIGMAQFRETPAARIPMELYGSFLRHRVEAGDLLIAGLGDEGRHAGRACLAPDLGPAMVKGKCFCARVNERVADPRYLALYLSSALGVDEVALVSHGSGRMMINLEIAKALPVVLPPPSRQTEIVDATLLEKERADRAIDLLGRQIDLLLERRQALITAAVTGQLAIPGVAA